MFKKHCLIQHTCVHKCLQTAYKRFHGSSNVGARASTRTRVITLGAGLVLLSIVNRICVEVLSFLGRGFRAMDHPVLTTLLAILQVCISQAAYISAFGQVKLYKLKTQRSTSVTIVGGTALVSLVVVASAPNH